MSAPSTCPECGSLETERVERRIPPVSTEARVEVWACNACYAGWEARWEDPEIEVVESSSVEEVRS